MAGWIKMPLGTEEGLSAGDIVLDDKRFEPSTVLWAFHAIQPSSYYFQSPKILGRTQPQTMCLWYRPFWPKNYTLEVRADQQKIVRYWTKYEIFCNSL